MATQKTKYEVLEAFALKAGADMFEVGSVVELTSAQATKFAANIKEIEAKLSQDDSADSDEEESADESASEDEGEKAPAEEKLQNTAHEMSADDAAEDYLMQYQFKNVNNVPCIGGPLTNPTVGSKAEIMKAALLKQPKVRMLVPRLPGEDPKVLQSVNLNGYRLDFPKQAYIYVPQQVADVLMESLQQTEKALAQFQIAGDKAKESAL